MGKDLIHPNIQLLDGTICNSGKKHKLPSTMGYLLKEYNAAFSRIGTLPEDEYHIKLKKDHKPVQHEPRLVPVKLQPAYNEELQRLFRKGVITPLREHTECTTTIASIWKFNGSHIWILRTKQEH